MATMKVAVLLVALLVSQHACCIGKVRQPWLWQISLNGDGPLTAHVTTATSAAATGLAPARPRCSLSMTSAQRLLAGRSVLCASDR